MFYKKKLRVIIMSVAPNLELEVTRNRDLGSSVTTFGADRRIISGISLDESERSLDERVQEAVNSMTISRGSSERTFVPTAYSRQTALYVPSLQIIDGRLTAVGAPPTHRPQTKYNIPLGPNLCVIGHGI